MLDRDLIAEGLITAIKDIVGTQLSTLTNPTGTTPAVIKARSRGPKPDLPYMTVDVANFILPSGWLLESYFDDDNVRNYDILYEMFVDIKCFGDKSQDILQALHSSLSLSAITERISTLALGASVQQQGDVINTPDLLSTDYQEGATLTVSFYIVDTIVDPTGTSLERILDVVAQGTLITGVNGDIIIDIDTQPL